MDAAADRLEFAPPPQPGLAGGLVIALLAHLLLLVALMWGVQWKRDAQDMAAEAELWASVPQEAAPQPVVVAPPPPPAPPAPVQRVEPKPEPPPQPRESDINVQREKEKREAARRAAEAEEERKERARKLAAEKEKQKRLEQDRQEKLAEQRRKEAEEKKRKEKEAEQRVAKLREDNLRRLQGLAGASGSPEARGTAQQSSGPSASWAGRVRARVKPNIVFTDDVAGNPSAEVEVKLAPDGTIVSRRLVKSSGHKPWDDAVMRALDKTEVLPRDTDGRVPPAGILVFRPKD